MIGNLVKASLLCLITMLSGWSSNALAFKSYQTDEKLAGVEVRVVFQDARGVYWFGSRHQGVFRYDGKNWQNYTQKDGLISDGILSILEDSDGNLWFAGGGGVQKLSEGGWTAYTLSEILPGLRVAFCVRQDNDRNIWVGTNAGAGRFDGESWRAYTQKDGLRHNVVHDILADSSGSIFFATRRGGLNKFDGKDWQVYLAESNCRALMLDKQGNLWVGTSSGVMLFAGDAWSTFMPEKALLPQCEDRNGNIWFASERQGVVKFDGTSWEWVTSPERAGSNVVFSVFEDATGDIWLGTDNGVARLQK